MSSSLFGGSTQQSNQASQYTSTPLNLQLPEYTGLAGGVSSGLGNIYGGYGFGNPGNFFGLSPFYAGGYSTNSPYNPLVAPLTGQQNDLIGQAYRLGMGGSGTLDTASADIKRFLDPTYPASVVNSPATQTAIASATNPIISAFNQTTMPGLTGQFTASGQRVNTAQTNPAAYKPGSEGYGKGSSAFDKAQANAQNNLLNTVANTSAGIANQAYQTGLQQQQAAIGQASQIQASQINNVIQTLQAVALPQLIQQYGINQGVSLFQNQIQTILSALGLGGQISQPAIGYNQQGTSFGSSYGQTSPDLLSGFGNAASGVVKIAGLF